VIDVLGNVAALRAFTTDPGNRAAAEWVADCVAEYLERADKGVTLEEIFGLKPGRGQSPWWEHKVRANRDAAIRYLARPFSVYPISEQARRVVDAASRYRRGRWRFDRGKAFVDYKDSKNRALFDMLRCTGGELPSEPIVRHALADREIPDLASNGHGPIAEEVIHDANWSE